MLEIQFSSERAYQECLVRAIACMYNDYYTDERFNPTIIRFDVDKYFCSYSDLNENVYVRGAFAFKVKFVDKEAFLYDFEVSNYFDGDFNSMHECKAFDEANEFYNDRFVAHFTLNEVIELLCENFAYADCKSKSDERIVSTKISMLAQDNDCLDIIVEVETEAFEIIEYPLIFSLYNCDITIDTDYKF